MLDHHPYKSSKFETSPAELLPELKALGDTLLPLTLVEPEKVLTGAAHHIKQTPSISHGAGQDVIHG